MRDCYALKVRKRIHDSLYWFITYVNNTNGFTFRLPQRFGNELVPAIDVAISIVEEVTEKADVYLARNMELDKLLKIHEMIAPFKDFEVIHGG